jgi:hypothetical protein
MCHYLTSPGRRRRTSRELRTIAMMMPVIVVGMVMADLHDSAWQRP